VFSAGGKRRHMLGRWYGGRRGHDCCRAVGESDPDAVSNLVGFAALSRVPWKTQSSGHHVHERRPSKDEDARMLNRLSCSVQELGLRAGCSGALVTGRGIYTDVEKSDT